ncbi:glycosyltransferase family 4 protein [Candidatus Parcubacteria bacterium]|nr:glycosyltransferase family 4 protein [Candidatus Parcubacteria bacterium]
MKIVIDGRIFGTGWMGIGRYSEELVRQLPELDHSNRYVVLLRRKEFDSWQPQSPNLTKQLADYKPYGLKEQLLLPLLLYRLRPDLVHFLHFSVPLAYFGRYVVTVHDLTLVKYKNIRGAGLKKVVYQLKYWLMLLVIRHAVMVAKAIIVPTGFVKDDILAKYRPGQTQGALSGKVSVTHEAVNPLMAQPAPIDRFGITGDYLLYVGNAYDYKNLSRLIEAFAALAPQFPGLSLVLAGKEDYFYRQRQRLARRLDLEGRVIFSGFVEDGELVSLYRQAKLFVFPSLSEGFGLPPLEAMAQGSPVIGSDASCMPEVCGDAAAYFDPLDPQDMAAKIAALLNDPAELERLKQAGPKHIKRFSWRRMAEQTLTVYRQVGRR